MKIKKIKVKNYRLLKNFELDLEDNLSLIVGKNNCGKTSLLSIVDKFIGNRSVSNDFTFDDFNSEFKDYLKTKIESNNQSETLGLSLKLFIEYDETDDLSNIGNSVIMDLEPENKTIVLLFEYTLKEFDTLIIDYNAFKEKESSKDDELRKDIFYFLKTNHKKYFEISKKSVFFNNETKEEEDDNFTDLIKEKIQINKIINFKIIDAKRDVSNKESEKALSSLSSKIYKKVESREVENEGIEQFKDALMTTDNHLDVVYETLFSDVLEDVKKFGGIKSGDSNIKIVSTLQHKELLGGNTTVMYSINDNHELPENYNGLGYMNLISMIFEIKILIHEFKKELSEKPADINLLFIEEPEAHTHPQMQYIFIENIKSLLDEGIKREDGENRKLQTIITTHSSHIISKSDFNDIKYLKKENNQVISKDLKNLKKDYTDDGKEKNYKFLKQYLTLHRAELFFADKAIFIEGDTERILLPTMMKKIDQEDSTGTTPLLSQNISIVEVGAYAHVFEKFIDFIGIKSLVITDIDSYYEKTIYETDGVTPKKNGNGSNKIEVIKCPVGDENAKYTSNASLKFFYDVNKDLQPFIDMTIENKKLIKSRENKKWVPHEEGHLVCIYQVNETNNNGDDYHARSFEDAFFHINQNFIQENLSNFPQGIKNSRYMKKSHEKFKDDVYFWADNCVNKKPPLAMEILLNSKSDDETGNQFINWEIPKYIKEGLLWLKQN